MTDDDGKPPILSTTLVSLQDPGVDFRLAVLQWMASVDRRLQGIEEVLSGSAQAQIDETNRRWAEVVGSLVFADLRPDHEDGDDIVIRYKGNKADWDRVRTLLKEAETALGSRALTK